MNGPPRPYHEYGDESGMTGQDRNSAGDKALWRRYRGRAYGPEAAASPDLELIAAFLDGRLTGPERAAAEAWLAATPAAVEVLVAAQRARLSGERPIVPREIIARAQALADPAAPQAATAPGWRERLADLPRLLPMAQWAAAAALLALACYAGFDLGLESGLALDDPAGDLEIAASEGPAFEAEAPLDGLFDPYGSDPFANGETS